MNTSSQTMSLTEESSNCSNRDYKYLRLETKLEEAGAGSGINFQQPVKKIQRIK